MTKEVNGSNWDEPTQLPTSQAFWAVGWGHHLLQAATCLDHLGHGHTEVHLWLFVTLIFLDLQAMTKG